METISVKNPFSGQELKQVPQQNFEAAAELLAKASLLFSDRKTWLPGWQRIAVLEKTASLMESQVETLTRIAVEEGGKPYTDSKIEVERAISSVKLAAASVARLTGEQVPMGINKASEHRIAFTSKEPIGVVFSISAFNHPLNLVVHQTATAIGAGCPVIIKPASATPLSCIHFASILEEAGLPSGWCNVLICSNEVAEKLVSDERIHYLSFIGSAKVGWYLRSKLAPGTRCALEHGGSAPVIVAEDADLAAVVPALLKGGFYHAGQVCVSVQRIFAHERICETLATALAEGAKNLVVGDPLDPATEVGPLIRAAEMQRVEEWVNEAVDKGAKILCGGAPVSDTCYSPTVLLDPPADVRVSTEEVFGPVVCIYSYKDRSDAIRRANALNLHFQAAVFTKDLDIALQCVNELNASTVLVNDHTAFRVDWMPFGGRDASGLGVGGILHTMNEMSREKLMVIKSGVL